MVEELLNKLAKPYTGEELFDQLPDLVYFIKDREGQYVVVNRTLVERCGVKSKSDLIGRTASEVLREPYGNQFEAQDRLVIKSGSPVLSRLELHIYPTRDVGWCLTTKQPLRDKRSKVQGLVGISQDLRLPDLKAKAYRQLAAVLEEAESQIANPPTVVEMAERAGMSRYQFDRRMRAVFCLSARQWLLKLRISMAEQLLRSSTQPIADVAMGVGYSDQSAFARQFTATTGFTPRAYRVAHRIEAEPSIHLAAKMKSIHNNR